MKLIIYLIALLVKFIEVENRMLPMKYSPLNQPPEEESSTTQDIEDQFLSQVPYQKVIGLKNGFEDRSQEESEFDLEKKPVNRALKKPCSILVLSNIQSLTMQSLLRKYRYDARGMLIPSSVKYFIKLPQGLDSAPVLVPLSEKAFSPLGGFVRYYKAVPPIPQSW